VPRFCLHHRLGPLATVLLALGAAVGARADIVSELGSDGVITLGNSRPHRSASTPATTSTSHERGHGRFDATITQAAVLYQIPESLVRAVITVESGFDPRALSPANARGLMQLIPATAERMQVEDPYDPRQNIFGGVRYLRVLANLFNGDLVLTVAAYNAGEGAVLRHGGIPPYAETQAYVQKVISNYRQLEAARREPAINAH